MYSRVHPPPSCNGYLFSCSIRPIWPCLWGPACLGDLRTHKHTDVNVMGCRSRDAGMWQAAKNAVKQRQRPQQILGMCSTDRKSGYRQQCALQTGSVATESNVLYTGSVATDRKWSYREEVWLQTAMCSTERKCGYRQEVWLQTAMYSTDRKWSYRQQCTLQTGSEATDSNVLYRHKVWRQSGNVVMSVKLQWGYLPVLQSPTVACLYRL